MKESQPVHFVFSSNKHLPKTIIPAFCLVQNYCLYALKIEPVRQVFFINSSSHTHLINESVSDAIITLHRASHRNVAILQSTESDLQTSSFSPSLHQQEYRQNKREAAQKWALTWKSTHPCFTQMPKTPPSTAVVERDKEHTAQPQLAPELWCFTPNPSPAKVI